jgi:branched-chain amino acid transport system permease protein
MPLAMRWRCAVRVYGLVVERWRCAPSRAAAPNAWLMATVALGIVLDNLVMFTFGKEPRGLFGSQALVKV